MQSECPPRAASNKAVGLPASKFSSLMSGLTFAVSSFWHDSLQPWLANQHMRGRGKTEVALR